MNSRNKAWWAAWLLSLAVLAFTATTVRGEAWVLALAVLGSQAWLAFAFLAARPPKAVTPNGQVPLDSIGVVVSTNTEHVELLAAAVAAGENAGYLVVLTESEATKALCARLQVDWTSPSDLLGKVPSSVEWLMFADTTVLVNVEGLASMAWCGQQEKSDWVIGVLDVQGYGAFSPEQQQKTDLTTLAAIASRGARAWAANATIIKVAALNQEHLNAAWGQGAGVFTPHYTHLLAGVDDRKAVTTAVAATWLPPIDPSRFFIKRLAGLENSVAATASAVVRSSSAKGKLWAASGLARQLRGWPWLVAVLFPAIMALSGMNPASIPLWIWLGLILAAGLSRVLASGPGVPSDLARDARSGLYELPVSIAATRGVFSPAPIPSKLAATFASRILAWIAFLEIIAAAAGFLLAASVASGFKDVQEAHLIGAVGAGIVGAVVMANAVRSWRWKETGRMSARVPHAGRIQVDGHPATLLDSSVGGLGFVNGSSNWQVGQEVSVRLDEQLTLTGKIVRKEDSIGVSFADGPVLEWNRWLREGAGWGSRI